MSNCKKPRHCMTTRESTHVYSHVSFPWISTQACSLSLSSKLNDDALNSASCSKGVTEKRTILPRRRHQLINSNHQLYIHIIYILFQNLIIIIIFCLPKKRIIARYIIFVWFRLLTKFLSTWNLRVVLVTSESEPESD